MSERGVPPSQYVYDEATNLESFSVLRTSGYIGAEVINVEAATYIPPEGQIVEFRVLGTSVQGVVTYVSLSRDGTRLLIQAKRLQD